MALVPAYAEAPLEQLATSLWKALRRPVRVEWATDSTCDPCACLDALERDGNGPNDYRRIATLTIRQRGPVATYVVTPVEAGETGKFAALATALRSLRLTVIRSHRNSTSITQQKEVSRAPARRASAASPRARMVGESSGRLTAVEAVDSPAIRAAVLTGHRTAEVTGRRVDPGAMLALVNASMPLLGMIADAAGADHTQDGHEVAAWTEAVLVAMLSGALQAAFPTPTRPHCGA